MHAEDGEEITDENSPKHEIVIDDGKWAGDYSKPYPTELEMFDAIVAQAREMIVAHEEGG